MGLESDPYDYRITADGKVLVSRGGRMVSTIAGKAAGKLIARLGQDDMQDQHLLARATGHYRHGNERLSK